jgi:hypothetical protein
MGGLRRSRQRPWQRPRSMRQRPPRKPARGLAVAAVAVGAGRAARVDEGGAVITPHPATCYMGNPYGRQCRVTAPPSRPRRDEEVLRRELDQLKASELLRRATADEVSGPAHDIVLSTHSFTRQLLSTVRGRQLPDPTGPARCRRTTSRRRRTRTRPSTPWSTSSSPPGAAPARRRPPRPRPRPPQVRLAVRYDAFGALGNTIPENVRLFQSSFPEMLQLSPRTRTFDRSIQAARCDKYLALRGSAWAHGGACGPCGGRWLRRAGPR